jgi:hypothetical protein
MKRYTYTVTQDGETLAVFDTYGEAKTYLYGIQPNNEQWEYRHYAIEEHWEYAQ